MSRMHGLTWSETEGKIDGRLIGLVLDGKWRALWRMLVGLLGGLGSRVLNMENIGW